LIRDSQTLGAFLAPEQSRKHRSRGIARLYASPDDSQSLPAKLSMKLSIDLALIKMVVRS